MTLIDKGCNRFCTIDHIICQMFGKPNQYSQLVSLIPIPHIEEPSSTVIIDCVGPFAL